MEMFFEDVNGRPVPVPTGDGPDVYPLSKAVARFGVDVDTLTRMFRAVWGKFIGDPGEVVAPATSEADSADPADATHPLVQTANATIRSIRLAALKRVKYPNVSQEHFDYFIAVCEQRGLSPWADQVYLDVEHDDAKGGPVPKIIVGIGGLRLIADRTGQRGGSDPVVFEFGDDPATPVSAMVTVYKFAGEREVKHTGVARWSDFYPGEGVSRVWDEYRCISLERCAEAAALRKAHTQELGGLYTSEEMANARAKKRKAKRDARANRERKTSLVDAGLPSSRRSLEVWLVERCNVTNKQQRAALMERLAGEFAFADNPDDGERYAEAAQAVANDLARYGVTGLGG
jgi:hypothetical protein